MTYVFFSIQRIGLCVGVCASYGRNNVGLPTSEVYITAGISVKT